MSPLRTLARPLLAAVFLAGGTEALRDPAPRVAAVRRAGLTGAERLVRVNASLHVVGGLGLATGRLPRLSAFLLAGSLVPTTVVGHPFWAETDPRVRTGQRVHFVKNLGLLGGLLLAVADTGGRPSRPHAAARGGRRARRRAAEAAQPTG